MNENLFCFCFSRLNGKRQTKLLLFCLFSLFSCSFSKGKKGAVDVCWVLGSAMEVWLVGHWLGLSQVEIMHKRCEDGFVDTRTCQVAPNTHTINHE